MTMDEDLREHKLLKAMDVLIEAHDPLTVEQIRYRLGRDHDITMSAEEITAHLRWGLHQHSATSGPVRPAYSPLLKKWTAVSKHPIIPEQSEAAGLPPWLVR